MNAFVDDSLSFIMINHTENNERTVSEVLFDIFIPVTCGVKGYTRLVEKYV